MLHGQTFRVDYLYRAPNKPNEVRRIYGFLTLDAAKRILIFTSKAERPWIRKQPALRIEIGAEAISHGTYERESSTYVFFGWGVFVNVVDDRHYVTLQYKTESGEAKYAIFHFENPLDHREGLAAIEATLGVGIVR